MVSFTLTNEQFLTERKMAYDLIKNDRLLKEIWIRHFHGYQTYIQITGSTNSGKSFNADYIYYILALGMYNYIPTFKDCYFKATDINTKITQITNRCVMNNEAGGRSKHWNDKQVEVWDNILQQQRVKRNTYIDCLPHRKEVSATLNIHINYLIVMENWIIDYLKKAVLIENIDIENIEDYEIIRIAKVYKYNVDYVGFNNNSNQNYFVTPYFFDQYQMPDFAKDDRFKLLNKFLEEYKEYDIKEKEKLAKLSEDNSIFGNNKKVKLNSLLKKESLGKYI